MSTLLSIIVMVVFQRKRSMTTIPRSAQAKFDLACRLTKEINAHAERFTSNPKHFHDRQAKKVGLEKKVHLRGIVLGALLKQNEDLYKRALVIIKSEIETGKEKAHA